MLSVLEIIKKTTDFFSAKKVEHPRLNAELLVGHALALKRMQLYLQFERLLSEAELEKIRPLVRRRALHEPLQYILGETEWSGLRLKTDRRALIPRPETELLVEMVVQAVYAGSEPARILDLGTGTGALAIALAKRWSGARVTAVDKSPDALALAGENAVALGVADRVALVQSDWYGSLALSNGEEFNLIVANPPYLSAAEVDEAADEVRLHEPRSALEAPDDGMADLRRIIDGAPRFLAAGGLLAMETGIAQHQALLTLCAQAGLPRTESRKDLTGRDRFVFAWKSTE